MAQNHLADIIICRSASYLTQHLHTDLLYIRKSETIFLLKFEKKILQMDIGTYIIDSYKIFSLCGASVLKKK